MHIYILIATNTSSMKHPATRAATSIAITAPTAAPTTPLLEVVGEVGLGVELMAVDVESGASGDVTVEVVDGGDVVGGGGSGVEDSKRRVDVEDGEGVSMMDGEGVGMMDGERSEGLTVGEDVSCAEVTFGEGVRVSWGKGDNDKPLPEPSCKNPDPIAVVVTPIAVLVCEVIVGDGGVLTAMLVADISGDVLLVEVTRTDALSVILRVLTEGLAVGEDPSMLVTCISEVVVGDGGVLEVLTAMPDVAGTSGDVLFVEFTRSDALSVVLLALPALAPCICISDNPATTNNTRIAEAIFMQKQSRESSATPQLRSRGVPLACTGQDVIVNWLFMFIILLFK